MYRAVGLAARASRGRRSRSRTRSRGRRDCRGVAHRARALGRRAAASCWTAGTSSEEIRRAGDLALRLGRLGHPRGPADASSPEQQRLGRERGGVLEGRDIGTKVFPDTPHKFFLTADPAVRAAPPHPGARRAGNPPALRGGPREMEKRDRDDSSTGRLAPDPGSPLYPDRLDRPGRRGRRGRDREAGSRGDLTRLAAEPIGYCFANQRLMRGDPFSNDGRKAQSDRRSGSRADGNRTGTDAPGVRTPPGPIRELLQELAGGTDHPRPRPRRSRPPR